MKRIPFSEKEMEILAVVPNRGNNPPSHKLNYPISPKENLLAMYRGETPLWIPLYNDTKPFGPDCESCDMAATAERADFKDAIPAEEAEAALEKVFTPGTKTIEDVCKYLNAPQEKSIKAILLAVQEDAKIPPKYVAAFVRGDRQVNMTKIVNALNVPEHAVGMADEAAMAAETGCVGGFTGPIGLKNCTIIVDTELIGAKNMCAGACETDHHYINVNYGRDYKADIIKDIKLLQADDPCPCCGAPVKSARGIEVGQVFKLGTKYSEPMNLTYLDENQQKQTVVMGCYGIGVTRTLAAVVEQHHDENGIIWPMSLAPYHVIVEIIKPDDEVQSKLADEIEAKLEAAGVEVVVDDRNERPGVKFKDAELLGFPIRINVGKRAPEGVVEYILRRNGEKEELSVEEAIAKAIALVNAERRG